MTEPENILWQKIESFRLNDPETAFKFSDRLARENGWSQEFTFAVIEEYKKFIFLCCIAENGVTPSDAVDQAWHLHLTFTKSYWNDFCRDTLNKEIHHNPTKGGEQEANKFDNYYTATKQLYLSKFGCEPPTSIWPENETRFSNIDFQRINRQQYWLIKKPMVKLTGPLLIVCIVLFGLTSINATSEYLPLIIFGFIFLAFLIIAFRNRGKGKAIPGYGVGGSGCGGGGCSTGGHHGDSGCNSGCSGCSGGGCSGCGGGD